MAKCFDRSSPAQPHTKNPSIWHLQIYNFSMEEGIWVITLLKISPLKKILATTNFNSHNLKLLYFT